ncbi:MAG: tetratricopeptide repeat protein [Prevotellaceae bacterium]|jgi:TolA-binding protein|nr:tetratricopeptide repeat protein [Prevotellaceae bacterium]
MKKLCNLAILGCLFSISIHAQTPEFPLSPDADYRQGSLLFTQKAYTAAHTLLSRYLTHSDEHRQEAEYMLTCIAYAQQDADVISRLETYLTTYPDTPHRHSLEAMLGSSYYLAGDYDTAVALLSSSNLEQLPTGERDKLTYQMAVSYYLTGNFREAAAWFEVLRTVDASCARSCAYYLGSIAYAQDNYAATIREYETFCDEGGALQHPDEYKLGMAYFQTKDYRQAATELLKATAYNDELTQSAYWHLGLAYLQLPENDRTKARMAFQQAAALDTDAGIKEQAAYNYAMCLYDTSFSAFGEAITVFERFLNEFPRSVYADRVNNHLMDVYLNTHSYEAALQSINRIKQPDQRVLEIKQNILLQLGTQAFAGGDFTRAIAYLGQAINAESNRKLTAEAYYWRAEAHYRTDQLPQATTDYTHYLNLTPPSAVNALVYYNLGYIAFRQTDYYRARTRLEQYVRSERDHPQSLADAYNRLGDCYLMTRDFSRANNAYAQAESFNTGVGDYSFFQMALVAGLQKDYAGKINLLNRLIGKFPASPYVTDAMYEKGRAYVLMDNRQQAGKTFEELLQRYPVAPVARKAAAEIGLLHYQANEYEQAIAAYKRVIERYPGSDEAKLALQDLQSIYIDTDRVDEYAQWTAEQPAGMRLNVNEQDSLTYVAAERIYARGQKEQAAASLQRYLQSFPEGAFALNAHYYLMRMANERKDYDAVLTHSAALIAYPDSPYAEEALLVRATVQYDQKQYADALTTYEQLREKASTDTNRILAEIGMLRAAFLTDAHTATIKAADYLLAETNLTPEQTNEARYCRAKAYLSEGNTQAALSDLTTLAQDTRNSFGAEARYLIAELSYRDRSYDAAEKELLSFIEVSTPHTYWLARGFLLLSDVYMAKGDTLDARQYLLSLRQNYSEKNDGIQDMITNQLNKLNAKP